MALTEEDRRRLPVSPVPEFLSDAPFSNLVSERCALLMDCACVSGWSCTHEPMQERSMSKESWGFHTASGRVSNSC